MNQEEKNRLYKICYKGKKGFSLLTAEEMEFCSLMLNKNEKEYGEIHKKACIDAMNSVSPFTQFKIEEIK